MKNKFNVIERFVTATPRSKRRASGVTNGGVVISGSEGSGSGAIDPNSHTHGNYELLEKISEQDGYLTLKLENTSDDPDAVPYIFEKIKSGYADNAGDAEKWDGHAFNDYLDQPLRKTDEVQFEAVIGSFRTPYFAGGMTGTGGRITSEGFGELEELIIRRSLTVPELNYNRVDISVGDDWSAPGGGVIESVDTEQRIVSLKLEEGEIGAVKAGDICMGIFHSMSPSENATVDADDGRGNRTFAGFATAYFRITEVLGDHSEQFKYELRPVSTSYPAQIPPMVSMNFVAYGSFTDSSRRTSRYSTRTYQRYLRGISDWEFTAENIAAQFGDLSNLAVFGLQMSGYSAYLDNIYMQGLLSSIDKTFIIDTKTRSLLMASGETGIGLAFNPGQGLKIGAVYDPETGKFQKEYDIEQIDKTATETSNAVDSLKNFTDEAFADGIVDRAEAASIEKYTNSVTETKDAADASYKTVYENSLLGGTAKSNLHAAKSAFDTAVADLLASISTASADGIATAEEKADVDTKYALFNSAYGTYTTRIEEAQKYIQTAINTTAQGAYQLSQELQSVVNNLNESIIPDLQNQIDKQIISYNGTDIPTLSNYPAVEWTTDTERNRHINDYYDRKITDSDGEVSYERYKFAYENNTYQWVRIADSGVAEAQAKALEALGIADSKNKTYFGDTTPAVPYSINDLWIKTSGDIYMCNADRLSGATGSTSDWQLVNDAQKRLRQMSSDNVISKEEKASLRNTLIQIERQIETYEEDAATYDVSMSALITAYQNLENFLTGTVAVNNDTDTELTPEQRASYNGYFAAYDIEVSRFANLIADSVAQSKVDGAMTDVDYLKNLFPKGASTEVDGAVIAQTLAVKNDAGSQVMGFINGSSNFSDPTHGICMIAMGMSSITGWNSAKTRLYADGHLVSGSAEITGQITAKTGQIGPFKISESDLTGTSSNSSLLLTASLIRFKTSYAATYIGADSTFPPSMGGSIIAPARFEVTRSATAGETNAGLYINVNGSTDYDDIASSGNHALYIAQGDICGLRLRVRRISNNTTLSEMDTFILVVASTRIALTLPSSPQPGQLYFIKLVGSGQFDVKVGASGHYINKGRSSHVTSWGFNSAVIVTLVWDRVNKIWQGGYIGAD